MQPVCVDLDSMDVAESALDKSRFGEKGRETGSALCAVETVHLRACLGATASLSNPFNTTEAVLILHSPPFSLPPSPSYYILNIHNRDSGT